MGKILTTKEGGEQVSPILTLTNKGGGGGFGEAKIMLALLMDSPKLLEYFGGKRKTKL